MILANYPSRDGRLANGVGLDTPQSLVEVLGAMRVAGYGIDHAPGDAASMMQLLQAGPTNALEERSARLGGMSWRLADYEAGFAELPENVRRAVEARWGKPEQDPHVVAGDSASACIVSAMSWSACSRRAATTSIPRAPITIPIWCRRIIISRSISGCGAISTPHAVVHLGKHGNLEWLPGKSTGLSAELPAGRGAGAAAASLSLYRQRSRRRHSGQAPPAAVIIDHLTPPMTRAELHDDLARLETLVDEYALAADLDPKRAAVIAEDILSLARAQRLDADVNVTRDTPTNDALRALDAHLCDLKEMQIRDGLHVFGRTPQEAQRNDLMVSIARLPRSDIKPQDASLHRALALDLGLGDFDPLTRDLADHFNGPRPEILSDVSEAAWRTVGDTVERIEFLALRLVSGVQPCDAGWERTKAVLDWIDAKLRPAIDACGDAEISSLAARARRPVRAARPVRRADPRPARCAADRAQFLRGRCARGADAIGVADRATWRPSAWSKAIGRRPANGRAPSRCRPGAPPTCAPAATMSRRRWR